MDGDVLRRVSHWADLRLRWDRVGPDGAMGLLVAPNQQELVASAWDRCTTSKGCGVVLIVAGRKRKQQTLFGDRGPRLHTEVDNLKPHNGQNGRSFPRQTGGGGQARGSVIGPARPESQCISPRAEYAIHIISDQGNIDGRVCGARMGLFSFLLFKSDTRYIS